jgi:hypothetical protein
MAYIDLSQKQLKKLIKEELDESQNYEFPDFMLTIATDTIKRWETTLDYNKLKKLKKAVDQLMKDFDGDE